jgi:hypothetical protein
LPVDPHLRELGRGGVSYGYLSKLEVIEKLRAKYFTENARKRASIFEDITAVPLDYLNSMLAMQNEQWRVRVIDGDEYEFFLP